MATKCSRCENLFSKIGRGGSCRSCGGRLCTSCTTIMNHIYDSGFPETPESLEANAVTLQKIIDVMRGKAMRLREEAALKQENREVIL